MRYSKLPLPDLIKYFISTGKEGEFWDFKLMWHDKIEDLLKDIICLANTVHDENGYIIFGISNDLYVKGISGYRTKQADILDAISHLVFAGDNIPQISVETIDYEGVELDVLIVHNTDKTPIYLKKPYGKMRMGCIYARNGDRNTQDNDNADISIVENLWRKRFGLTKPPIDFIFDALDNKLEWTKSENGYYHIFRPEYTIEFVEEDDTYRSESDEFYSYTQTNSSTHFFSLVIKARGTILKRFQVVTLDGGRLSIPVPNWGSIHFDNLHRNSVAYKFYIMDSRSEKLMRFMYDPENDEQYCAYNSFEKVILYFQNTLEQQDFEKYMRDKTAELKERVDKCDAYRYLNGEKNQKTTAYTKTLRESVVLKEMLEEFRKSRPLNI